MSTEIDKNVYGDSGKFENEKGLDQEEVDLNSNREAKYV